MESCYEGGGLACLLQLVEARTPIIAWMDSASISIPKKSIIDICNYDRRKRRIRNQSRGEEVVEKLNAYGLSNIVFHQLDINNPSSIVCLAEFVQKHFGKLDILAAEALNAIATDLHPKICRHKKTA
ncbi:hypothetical protein L1987_28807 [Smallanthus sonchifolius]|uniref:Uncharacterized protein n=1 Tax=Smallanthus sonchifolius TaxID=185202 RepID=A0ACB9HZ31_9ASTR|nr:hypothetical protein L1987_28807 [Smallanthus sonchifolius]